MDDQMSLLAQPPDPTRRTPRGGARRTAPPATDAAAGENPLTSRVRQVIADELARAVAQGVAQDIDARTDAP